MKMGEKTGVVFIVLSTIPTSLLLDGYINCVSPLEPVPFVSRPTPSVAPRPGLSGAPRCFGFPKSPPGPKAPPPAALSIET